MTNQQGGIAMDWLMARKSTESGIKKCYLYGMGSDISDKEVKTIITLHAKIGGTMCLLAAVKPVYKEFVSLYDWHVILRTEQEQP